jgi:hypothetical protein
MMHGVSQLHQRWSANHLFSRQGIRHELHPFADSQDQENPKMKLDSHEI